MKAKEEIKNGHNDFRIKNIFCSAEPQLFVGGRVSWLYMCIYLRLVVSNTMRYMADAL